MTANGTSSAPLKRVGVIVPSLNTIIEDDFRQYLPADVAYHTARLRLRKVDGKVTHDSLREAGEEAPAIAQYLSDAMVDAIAFNCTGACAEGGPEANARIERSIVESTGVPATTTLSALLQAIEELGIRRLVHVSPFTSSFGNDEADFLRASGCDVIETACMNHVDARAVAKLEPREFVEFAQRTDTSDADAVFLACANARTLAAVDELEDILDKPVLTSNQVVIWALLKLVGRLTPIAGGGRLFTSHAVR